MRPEIATEVQSNGRDLNSAWLLRAAHDFRRTSEKTLAARPHRGQR